MQKPNLISYVDRNLLVEEIEDLRYANSPFRNLKKMHAKQKGKRYEEITEQVLLKLGRDVRKPTSTEHDRIVDGLKIEIKGSTLNKNTDHFSFLQIRPNQNYDAIYFSMFYPESLVIMSMTKQVVKDNIKLKIFKKQHGGVAANSGTYMYYGNCESLENIGAIYIK